MLTTNFKSYVAEVEKFVHDPRLNWGGRVEARIIVIPASSEEEAREQLVKDGWTVISIRESEEDKSLLIDESSYGDHDK
jgi:hypothetical protein